MGGETAAAARKVMVVVDPTVQSAGALEYALYHAILEHDTLILFHVENPNTWIKNPFGVLFRKPLTTADNNGIVATPNIISSATSTSAAGAVESGGVVAADFLDSMKRVCMDAKPKLKVVVEKAEMVDGKDKASVILAHSTAYNVDLIIIGQRKSLSNAILGSRRGGSLRGFDTADYLIENSKCNCIAVQKKGQNAGYLLNSKTHKNFWQLA